MKTKSKLRDFHEAKWNEPIIFELSSDGQRGILIPEVDKEIQEEIGDIKELMPRGLFRENKPNKC